MARDMFEEFLWHSAIGMDDALCGGKRVARLPNSKKALSMFVASSNNTLIHKTTKCLWRFNKDKTAIEPVFATDVLTEEDCREAMGENYEFE